MDRNTGAILMQRYAVDLIWRASGGLAGISSAGDSLMIGGEQVLKVELRQLFPRVAGQRLVCAIAEQNGARGAHDEHGQLGHVEG